MSSIQLIVGLGNPGQAYAATRHNVGYWFIDELVNKANSQLKKETKFHALIAKVHLFGHSCWLMQPLTFMNDSGQAVQAFCHFYKIPLQNTLVAHDDLDHAAGTIRLKQNGGHGGHNGLRDIIQRCGGHDFYRMRIGIGHPGHKDSVTPYVLGQPSAKDRELIDLAITQGIQALSTLLEGDVQKAIRELHNN